MPLERKNPGDPVRAEDWNKLVEQLTALRVSGAGKPKSGDLRALLQDTRPEEWLTCIVLAVSPPTAPSAPERAGDIRYTFQARRRPGVGGVAGGPDGITVVRPHNDLKRVYAVPVGGACWLARIPDDEDPGRWKPALVVIEKDAVRQCSV